MTTIDAEMYVNGMTPDRPFSSFSQGKKEEDTSCLTTLYNAIFCSACCCCSTSQRNGVNGQSIIDKMSNVPEVNERSSLLADASSSVISATKPLNLYIEDKGFSISIHRGRELPSGDSDTFSQPSS